MTYKAEIIGITNIITCETLTELYQALLDAQCVKNPTVKHALEMADALATHGEYMGTVAEDKRFTYIVRRY